MRHTLASVEEGSVRYWGWNNYGQVRDRSYDNTYTTTQKSS